MAINDKVSNSSIYSCQYNMEGSDLTVGEERAKKCVLELKATKPATSLDFPQIQ